MDMDYKYDTPLPLQSYNPRQIKRTWDTAAKLAGATGTFIAHKARRLTPYITPGNVGLAAIGAGVARRYIGRSSRTGRLLRDAGPAGRVLRYRRKGRRGRRWRMMRKRRVRRMKNLRRMVNQIMNPRLTYIINYTNKCDQSYNRKKWQILDEIFTNNNKQGLSAYYNNKTYSANDWFYLDSIDLQFQLVNSSNSETYVTVYVMKCVDNTSSSVTDYMAADNTAGNVGTTAIPATGTNYFEGDRALTLSAFQRFRRFWKIHRKKYFKMEGGGTVTCRYKMPIKRSLNPTIHNLDDGTSFYKGLSYTVMLEVRSQIVKNTDASAGVVWDNASVLYGSNVKYRGGALMQVTRRNANMNAVYVTASAPQVVTDVDSKAT